MTGTTISFRALLVTQALSAFNHNQLRSALLTLVAFREFDLYGLTAEAVAALSTIGIVAPYAVLSIPGGRFADKWPKATVIQTVKASEIAVFLLAGIGLLLLSIPLLLLAILLAGIHAALLGPAKFGVLPELMPPNELVSGNAWMSATSTLAILAGLVTGNLLILREWGLCVVAICGVVLGIVGWITSLAVPVTKAQAPDLRLRLSDLALDFWTCFRQLGAVPLTILPILGCSWFWFQGALNTTLFPLYVAGSKGQSETIVSLLLIVSSLGVALGALCASWLMTRAARAWLPVPLFFLIALPGLDIWLVGAMASQQDVLRVVVDFFVLAVGAGLYVVPLHAALQIFTPDAERARFIGANHTVNGIAMISSGIVILILSAASISLAIIFFATAVATGFVAAWTLGSTLRALTNDLVGAADG